MSAFDTQLNIVHREVVPLQDPQDPEKATAAEIRLVNAAILPTPDGAIPIVLGQYRFGIAKGALQEFIGELQEVLDGLEDPKPRSNIAIATDLNAAKEAAERAQQLRA